MKRFCVLRSAVTPGSDSFSCSSEYIYIYMGEWLYVKKTRHYTFTFFFAPTIPEIITIFMVLSEQCQ